MGVEMRKIDTHVHVAQRRTHVDIGNPRKPETHYVAAPEEMLSVMERQGIERAVIMSAGESAQYDSSGMNVYNTDCAAICGSYPSKFSWMCNFDNRSLDTIGERMAECKEKGAVGVGEVSENEWLDSPYFKALFLAAEELSMPVTFHMSPEPGFSYGVCDRPGLPLLEKTLMDYPDLIIAGHSQVFWLEISADCPKEGNRERSGFGKGPVARGGTVERLLRTYSNLYCDLSAFSAYTAITRDEEYGLWFLETFNDRLFFATDAMNELTVPPLGAYLDDAAAKGAISQRAYENITRNNALRIYFNS